MKFRADSFLLSKNAFLVIFLHFYLIVMKNNDCKEFIINLARHSKKIINKKNRNDQMRYMYEYTIIYTKLHCMSFRSEFFPFVNDY